MVASTNTKAKAKVHRYAHHSSRIFGLKCSQHRTNKMRMVLKHYRYRAGAYANTKEILLTRLDDLQKTVDGSNAAAIQEWFQSPSESDDMMRFILGGRIGDAPPDNKIKRKDKHHGPVSPQRPALKECAVCTEDLPEDHFPDQKITSMCRHEPTTCLNCLQACITAQVPDFTWDHITCPECPEQLSYDTVKLLASAEIFEVYDKKSFMTAMDGIPGFTPCLAPGCGAGQIHEGGDEEPIMTCVTCRSKTCFTHKMPWHSGQTCAEYDEVQKERMEQEAASENVVAATSKRCPNCDLAISKVSGCDHMTCSKCQFQFCYLCRVPWRTIIMQSNAAHDPACKYHTRNLPTMHNAHAIPNRERVHPAMRNTHANRQRHDPMDELLLEVLGDDPAYRG